MIKTDALRQRFYQLYSTTQLSHMHSFVCHEKSVAWTIHVISPEIIMWAMASKLFGYLASLEVLKFTLPQDIPSPRRIAWAVASSFSHGERGGGDVNTPLWGGLTDMAHSRNPCLSWYYDSLWHINTFTRTQTMWTCIYVLPTNAELIVIAMVPHYITRKNLMSFLRSPASHHNHMIRRRHWSWYYARPSLKLPPPTQSRNHPSRAWISKVVGWNGQHAHGEIQSQGQKKPAAPLWPNK
jgi:hypothetical protein